MRPPLEFGYTNIRGEYAVRRVQPDVIYYGVTDYYPTPQWLMSGYDVDRDVFRTFAMANMRLDCPRCRDHDAAVINEHKQDPYSGR